jgi:magnesium transporter
MEEKKTDPPIAERLSRRGPRDAAALLAPMDDAAVAAALAEVHHEKAADVLEQLKPERRASVLAKAAPDDAEQWTRSLSYPAGSVGRLMARPRAVFAPEMTVAQATEQLRAIVKHTFVTYAYVVDPQRRLLGVVVMREMLLARPDDRLEQIMLRDPFSLRPDMTQMDAMREVVGRHYPVYPVCDAEGRLVGLVRGSVLFERQAVEITAMPGTMVGVEKEERLATPWPRSFRSRHPWLQLNLLTAFVAAAVVGAFEATIDRVVALAVFLPVLAGQSGNTGCQALAVALRAMTLGELRHGKERAALVKEALLGLLNGVFVGITAGAGMYFYARWTGTEGAPILALVVTTAMTGACVVSGISGVLIPVTLKRLGADPATASSIFLTTATDVASMGLFLLLATYLV